MIRPAVASQPVELTDACASYGQGLAVDRVSITVPRGTCIGLLGPNGAGKSTTLKMIYGFLRPAAGWVRIEGVDVARHPQRARRVLGVVPQEDTLDADLTVVENLYFHGRYCGLARGEARRRAAEGLERALLGDRGAQKVSELSAGLRRRVVLARALLNAPSVLVLDEPTRGLDAASRAECLGTVLRLKAAGVAVVLATHDLEEASLLCDAAVLMRRGRVACAGETPSVVAALQEDEAPEARGTAG